MPDELAKNRELGDGELVDVGSNNLEHNLIKDFIGRQLAFFVGERGLGIVVTEQEYDFDGNAHGPDVSYFCKAKMLLIDLRKRVQLFVPDLAVEVVSPNNPFQTLMRKKERYRKCCTSEV